jgi:uncharacterized protein
MTWPGFQIFVKPVGPSCNLACEYCYYTEKEGLFNHHKLFAMSDSLLECYISRHIEASSSDIIAFSWHGGEPLLAGLEFYSKAVALQKKYCPVDKKIVNGIQTNGTLINAEWSKFLAKEQFSVGISIDGPEELHNRFRKHKHGQNSFQEALHGYDLLVMHDIDPEILCVVNAENVHYPLQLYRFFRDLGVSYITFIPLVERLSANHGSVSHRTVNANDFGGFLCAIFDEWVQNDMGKVKVQIFEEALRTAFNQDHTLCIFKVTCGGVPVVEHNGDFYSCDHFVNAENLLGNIGNVALADLLESRKQKIFGQQKLATLPEYCLKCEVRPMCNGECPKNRIITTPDGTPGLNYLCAGYRMFFNHCTPFVKAVEKAYKNKY